MIWPRRQLDAGCLAIGALATVLGLAGCREDPMRDQPKYETFEGAAFFGDGTSARMRVTGTVATSDVPATEAVRPAVDMPLLRRGQERFNIFCAPCHGRDGFGEGMIVTRGYPQPPQLHEERLRTLPDEHFYAVIEKGIGKMPPYGASLVERDRWAVVAYVRALQRSRLGTPADVPANERKALEDGTPAASGS